MATKRWRLDYRKKDRRYTLIFMLSTERINSDMPFLGLASRAVAAAACWRRLNAYDCFGVWIDQYGTEAVRSPISEVALCGPAAFERAKLDAVFARI